MDEYAKQILLRRLPALAVTALILLYGWLLG
jgi:hypothetical protein